MPSTRDIILGKKLNILLIGRNGLGKTCQVATFAECGPGKIFDFDGRQDSIKKVHPTLDIQYDTYGVFDVEGSDDRAPIKSLDKFLEEFIHLAKDCPYKWICVDSITSLSNTLVNYQMVSGGGGKSTKGGLSVPGFDEFNGEASKVAQMLDVCRIIPAHVIFTAHPIEKIKVDPSGGGGKVVEKIVAFGHKVPSMLPTYFNEIFFLDYEESTNASKPPERVIYTAASPGIFAKTTLPLERRVVLPDEGPGLYQVIQNALGK